MFDNKNKRKKPRQSLPGLSVFCIKFCFYLVFGCGKIRSETESMIIKMPYDFIYQQLMFTSRQQK